MRRLGSGGASVALLLGLGAVAIAAGGADYHGQSAPKGILSDMFSPKSQAPAVKGNQPIANGNQPIAPRPTPTHSTEMDAAEQQRQSKANMRRMEVCDRLRMIALQSGNEALMNLANELEDRANEIYRRKTSHSPLVIQTPPSTGGAEQRAANRQTEPMAVNGSGNAEGKGAPR